jgi:hypothetical protein
MTPLHIKQIATVIQRDYAPQLDLTDVATRPPQDLVLQQRLVTLSSAGVVRFAGAGLPVASPA